MTEYLRRHCELLVGNYAILKREFKFDNALFKMIGAGIFASSNAIADTARIKECRYLLNKKTNAYSLYRAFGHPAFSVLLAVEDDPESTLCRTIDAYRALRKYFSRSYYTAVAAYILAKQSNTSLTELAARTRAIFKLMRALNRGETSQRDLVYAAVRATENKLNAEIAKIEQACSAEIDGVLPKRQKIRIVHSIAVFADDHGRAAERLADLISLLRAQKYRYGKCYELNALTVLAMTDVPENELIESMIAVYKYLRERREFSRFMLKSELLMISAFAVLGANSKPSTSVAENTAVALTLAEYATVLASQVCY